MLDKIILNSQLISRRIFLLIFGKLALLFLLLGRMFYMQVLKQNEYKTLSDKNRINLILNPPPRGKIYDLQDKLLADNKSCFRLFLDRTVGDYKTQVKLLSDILSLSQDVIGEIEKKISKSSRRIPVMILDNLNWQQISVVEEQKLYLSSIFIDVGLSRFYPFNNIVAHILGYVGILNEQEKQELNINNIADFNVGKYGIEKYYENKLRGEFGYKQIEVNAYGKQVREITNVPSSSGSDLYINIDLSLQQKAMSYLSETHSASAIVMDCRTGGVLILASWPSFESNKFIKLSQKYWNQLTMDIYKPLINKTIQTAYPPGSVFKLITVLAALEAGTTPNKTVYCSGLSNIGTNSFRCHKHSGHGTIDMLNALKYSCNSYMYELSRTIGAEKIIETARKFGFGSKTNIDLHGEVSGFVPSSEWKKKIFKNRWTIGDSLNISIGQGALLATPIQLVNFVTSIATNGKLYRPHILKSDPIFEMIDIKQTSFDVVKQAMHRAVNTEGGTAYYSRILNENHIMAGKTGTSQVQAKTSANDDLNRETISWERRNHASFVGFAPYHNPQYAILVFVNHGGGGGRVAAPIASKILSDVMVKYS